jgi:drug/metabolite transporter (DMT)-like permease
MEEKKVHMPPKDRLAIAIGASLLASLTYACMMAFTKYGTVLFTTTQLVFYRSLISLVLICAWIGLHRKKQSFIHHLKTKEIKTHFIRSLAALTTLFLFFFALKTISISEASVLFNTTPIFVPITAYIWKGINIDHRLWPGIGIAFIGIIVLLHPETNRFDPGMWVGLLGGIVGSIAMMALRLSHYTEPMSRTIFYYFAFSTLLSLIILLFQGLSFEFLRNKEAVFLIVMVGVTGFLYQIFFSLALKYAPARLISPFFYASVIFGLLLDHYIWGSKLLFSEIWGIILVFIGVCLVVFLYPKKRVAPR